EAERATVLDRLVHALLDRGDVLLRDHAADDGVRELQARAPLERFDAQPRDRELAVATGLLLDLAFGLGGAGDRLAVGHAHVLGLDLDAELARELLDRDRHVRLAHAAHQRLGRPGVALYA